VIALSRTIADDLGRGAVVIRPGVDLERFRPDGRQRSDHALFLSAMTPWKRPELAIEAATEAGVPLVIAGAPLDASGQELEQRLRAEAPPTVKFAGRVPDPAAELRRAAVLLHCADREPYGMALVEALACGVPVVAPAAGGAREIADDSCARLYRPGDAHAAAAALQAALAAREGLSRAARERAERHFDLRESRRRYAELFDGAPSAAAGAGIALVTVLHDSEHEVKSLMSSLDRHLPGAHLIAVDSGSTDAGPQAVRDWTGNGTVIELGENAGYGRGTNAGVAAAEEPVTVVINPDVELLDASLADLARAASEHPDRILAPLVLLPDGTRQDSVHPMPASPPELIRAAVPPPALQHALDPWRANEPARVGWAVGCCIAASTETLRRLGPFDDRAFLYAEDLDLGLRAQEQQIETWFWPHARVLHHRAHATGRAFELLAERRREVVAERLGRGAQRRDDLVQAATFANRIALKTLLHKPANRERRQLKALLRTRRGRSAR
jgi:GT2 family glycosyltransferase